MEIFTSTETKVVDRYPKREKKSGLGTTIKSFHSGY